MPSPAQEGAWLPHLELRAGSLCSRGPFCRVPHDIASRAARGAQSGAGDKKVPPAGQETCGGSLGISEGLLLAARSLELGDPLCP